MSLTLLHGDNAIQLREALKKLKTQAGGDPSLAALNTIELEGSDIRLVDLQSLCATSGFLGQRTVIVTGLGMRVEPQQRGTAEKPPQQPLAKQQSNEDIPARPLPSALSSHPQEIARHLKALGEQAELVFVDAQRLSPQNPLRRAVTTAGGKILFFAAPSPEHLQAWIDTRVRQRGAKISREAAQLLAAFSSQDMLALEQEIDKLVTYADAGTIDVDAIRSLVSSSHQTVIFALVDALGIGDWAGALRLAHRLIQEGANPAYLFAMILRQFRILVQLKDWASREATAEEIAAALHLHPYVVQKALPQARRFSGQQLAAIYHRLLAIDRGVKTGATDMDVALDLLIAQGERSSP